jgi:hypothetical protein
MVDTEIIVVQPPYIRDKETKVQRSGSDLPKTTKGVGGSKVCNCESVSLWSKRTYRLAAHHVPDIALKPVQGT